MAIPGNYGRFSERLKKIANRKKKKNKNVLIEDSEKIYKNFLKVSAAIPLMVYDNIKDVNNSDKELVDNSINKNKQVVYDEKLKDIKNIDTSSMIKQQKYTYKKNTSVGNTNESFVNLEDRKKELEKKIINLIKKDLIKTVNELEVLQSELYILSEVNKDDVVLEKCKKNIDEVKNILCKIDKLKKKYEFLKDNYDFEYILEIGDSKLVDNILELKNLLSTEDLKITAEDYKLLDVYKYLYLRIDQINDETNEFEQYKDNQVKELEKRDIDFEELKKKAYNMDDVSRGYEYFVERQNELLKQLNEKVGLIDSTEIVKYRLHGFGELLANSFKYLGLLMLNPLKGVIPSIATETVATRNVIANLNNNLHWEEHRETIYNAIDYTTEIRGAIDDLSFTGNVVDKTLEDIVKLKMTYNEKFKQYQGDIYEYEKVIGKINDMENKIMGNKIKIEIMKKKMLEKEKANVKVLIKVKEMNRENAS